MKKFATEIAEEIRGWLESAEVKSVIDATEKAADAESGTFEVIITTENLDRYGEVISLEGWELEHYRNNPVVLWGHDHHTLPIGVANSVEIVDGKMIAKGRFAPHAHAQEIRSLYDAGILRATSVGFIEKEREGNLITKAELIEFSFVSVPANPYALSLALEKEIGINELVTKGFIEIQTKEVDPEPETPAEVPAEEDPTPEAETPAPAAEKQFSAKQLSPVLEQARALVIALEALGDEEPEREETPAPESEDEKALKEFSEKRRIVQQAATLLGEVLAEARQAIEAQREEHGA